MLPPGALPGLASLCLGQPADTVEAPLILALFWGYGPAVLGFVVGGGRRGFALALSRCPWLLLPPAAILLLWWSTCVLVDLPDELGPKITFYGGIVLSWAVTIVALAVPRRRRTGAATDRHSARTRISP